MCRSRRVVHPAEAAAASQDQQSIDQGAGVSSVPWSAGAEGRPPMMRSRGTSEVPHAVPAHFFVSAMAWLT